MINFVANILHQNSLLEAKFFQVVAPHNKFFVEIGKPTGPATCFEMQVNNFDEWQVIHPAEDWIIGLQRQLHGIISSKLN